MARRRSGARRRGGGVAERRGAHAAARRSLHGGTICCFVRGRDGVAAAARSICNIAAARLSMASYVYQAYHISNILKAQ